MSRGRYRLQGGGQPLAKPAAPYNFANVPNCVVCEETGLQVIRALCASPKIVSCSSLECLVADLVWSLVLYYLTC